ncbi:E3 ubiquitin-protein ligase rnf13 [Mortierella alpina]|nr:E3 ubiquitin-protein ligase rnf13 [Mortierella alpina]
MSLFRGRSIHAVILLLVLQLLVLTGPLSTVEGNVFGGTVAKLSFDRISVRNRPSDVGSADLIEGGAGLQAGIISSTGAIQKEGISGILFDMGYACTPNADNTTLPIPEFYGLPRIALIRRGGPSEDSACSFRTKMINAQANNSIGALIYNNPGTTALDGATAAVDSSGVLLEIPGMLISYDDGMMLRTFLIQTQDIGSVDFNNRVRVSMGLERKMPVIWEFVLIIVVVLLAVSFVVSVVLHCRLYALRHRIRMDALARGADVLPNGTIRMRKITLDKTILDGLPVRIYGHDTIAGSATTPVDASMPASSSTPQPEPQPPQPQEQERQDQSKGNAGATQATQATQATLSRTNSLKSISGKSIRSLRAIAAATALNSNASPSPAVVPPASHVDEVTADTCAVCLDEFEKGEEIRTLPCHHEFHCECIDPWLTRKSSTCPLCKYDCVPQSMEEVVGRGEEANIVTPNDRFIEFVMGPEWVAARTMRGHNGTSMVDRVGHFFGVMNDRLHGRPPRLPPRATVETSSLYRESAHSNRMVTLDENGQVPLQLITPRGVSSAPAPSSSPSSYSGVRTPSLRTASVASSGPVVISIPAPSSTTLAAATGAVGDSVSGSGVPEVEAAPDASVIVEMPSSAAEATASKDSGRKEAEH